MKKNDEWKAIIFEFIILGCGLCVRDEGSLLISDLHRKHEGHQWERDARRRQDSRAIKLRNPFFVRIVIDQSQN